MKRKTLISIALITIMLLNCILPLFVVNAAENEEIRLNSNLYQAIVASLEKQGIEVECNEITHSITLNDEVISSVKELNLNEKGISDLTGLDVFTSLERLELSGNELDKDSNLDVLNKLPKLKHLDLSTNKLDDVSAISNLIDSLKENGTIVLSGQTVTKVETAYVDSEEESDNSPTAEFDLPSILNLAGYIKSAWKEITRYSQAVNPKQTEVGTPSINHIPGEVTSEDGKIVVNIADESGIGHYGLVKVYIYINDDETEAKNPTNLNKASENILNGSRFYLYYVVHDSSSEAITTVDSNLYDAIKEQLTGGQKVNSDLSSFPYATNANGEVIYEDFTFEEKDIQENTYRVLTNVETKKEQYVYDNKTDRLYKYTDGESLGEEVITEIQNISIQETDKKGIVTTKEGYRIAYKSDESGETLYKAAYDDAKTFVIDDLVLTNKITSLILNNKKISDLSGIEYFIGLCSELNVSHNYLDDIDSIYELDNQKDYWETQMIENYTNYLNKRVYGNLLKSTDAAEQSMKTIEEKIKAINDLIPQIKNIVKEAAEADSAGESYSKDTENRKKSINDLLKAVYTYTDEEGNEVVGLKNEIDNILSSGNPDGLNNSIKDMYEYLDVLYEIYNNEYKLTTLLTPELNYQTYEEYETYKNSLKTLEQAKALLEGEINYISELESQNGLSELDKKLLNKAFSINFETTDSETPFADYFKDYLDKTPIDRLGAVSLINKFVEIGLYSEMSNYCLINRMNKETAKEYCYQEDYLENRIKELEYEEIPATLEKDVLNNIREGKDYSTLYTEYKTYTKEEHTYESDTVYSCKGEYKKLDSIDVEYVNYSKEKEGNLIEEALQDSTKTGDDTAKTQAETLLNGVSSEIIKEVKLVEKENSKKSEANKLFLYNQLISLSRKLLKGDVSRYIKLARLKKLDVSYNAELDNLEGITTLETLSDLNASYCYISDLTNIDWTTMTKLRRVNLAYNFISDIKELTKFVNLRYLNLSNNLISGQLDISYSEYEKLFKKLQEIDLSGNQINDISSLLIYLDSITNGEYSNYLAGEDTVNVNLKNQNLVMEIEEPFDLAKDPVTVNVEIPKIFKQLLAIDTERTAFGHTSEDGRIVSTGDQVTLNTRTVGEKEALVNVIAMSGNGQKVDTCIGEGTNLKIKYSVINTSTGEEDPSKPPVPPEKETKIEITPSDGQTVKAGETLDFNVRIDEQEADDKVNWTISGNSSNSTTISDDGVLTVDKDETSKSITVTATSKENGDVSISTTVTIEKASEDEPQAGLDKTVESVSNLGYIKDETYLKEIAPKTPVADFERIFLNGKDYNVVITKDEDSQDITTGYMETGMLVKLLDENNNNVVDESENPIVYEIVVKGDANGDGLANSVDSLLIKAHRSEVQKLNGGALESADLNKDENINITDVKLLLYHRAEVKGYVFNYTK